MAIAKVVGNLSFKVLPNEIRKRFKGTMSYTGVDVNDKWIYMKVLVTHSVAALMGVVDDFLTVTNNTDDPAAASDNVRFLIMKHTGFLTTGESTATTYGVLISFDNTSPAWNTTASAGTPLFLAPGDTMVLKLPNLTVEGLHARTCSISSGIPSADGTSGQNAYIEIAAILDDVA